MPYVSCGWWWIDKHTVSSGVDEIIMSGWNVLISLEQRGRERERVQ